MAKDGIFKQVKKYLFKANKSRLNERELFFHLCKH